MLPRQTGRGLSGQVVTFMILSRIGKNSAGARHFVKKSARLSHVRTYGTTISPRSMHSRM